MDGSPNYVSAFACFFGPILLAAWAAFAWTKFGKSRLGRTTLGNTTGIVLFAVSNLSFLALNSSLEVGPLGTLGTWPQLWLFAFLPVSIIYSIAAVAFINHVFEDMPSENSKHWGKS